MDLEELCKLRQSIAENRNDATESGGFGVVNVNKRIHSYYGGEYGIWYESTSGEGTVVTVSIAAKNI